MWVFGGLWHKIFRHLTMDQLVTHFSFYKQLHFEFSPWVAWLSKSNFSKFTLPYLSIIMFKMFFRVEAFFLCNKKLKTFNILEVSLKIWPKSQPRPLATELLIKRKMCSPWCTFLEIDSLVFSWVFGGVYDTRSPDGSVS